MDNNTEDEQAASALSEDTALAIKRVLNQSWSAIGYEYDKLTTEEQLMLTREQFDNIRKWAGMNHRGEGT